MFKNMFKTSRLFFTIILLMLMVIAVTPACYGNAGEPPSILIIVANAPDDLEISIGSDNTYAKASKNDRAIETYYTFYSHDLRFVDSYTVKINTGNSAFEILLEKPLKSYNNIYTLDLDNRTLTPGKLLSRSIVLVSLRIFLTLLIEAIVFWLYGFRCKKSWIVFLAINLITQGALNIWLNGFGPLANYIILTLVLGEILVFIAEIVAFLTLIQEHHPMRIFFYVITSNLLSLFAGGYIITVLPI
ncbi:MAG: hypothetical protein PWR12_1133 [Eubacteriaceae bacterium]|nr:hypothetical protein [Eubacteriaceae bacterium]MDN5300963.1 hypothetical protein [Thermoanaerobacteraceae bacterium]